MCNKWDPSVPIDVQLRKLEVVGNQSQAQLDSQSSLNPLCKQHNECAGWGANALTGSPALFNAVRLTYTDKTKSFEGMLEPVEAQVDPVLGPQFSIDTETFPGISDYTNYVQTRFSAHSPPQGTNGIYGDSFKDVMQPYFLRCPNLGSCDSLSVSSAVRSIVSLALPFDPVMNKYTFTLDDNAQRAIQSLPPPSVYANISGWWGTYGGLFRSFFDKYGTDVIVEASMGGIVEQYSSFDEALGTTLGEDTLLKDAKIDFTTATGIGGHTGTLDPSYTPDLSPLTCIGGDPEKCTKDGIAGGSWGDSTKTAPRLLQYKIVPLSELLVGQNETSIKKSLEAAAEQYVAEGQRQWQDYYNAYISCQPPFKWPNDPHHCTPQWNCSGGASTLVQTDCNAWVSLFDATGGLKWNTCSQNRLSPCACIGSFVECTGGHVTALGNLNTSLDTNILYGTIPSEISQMKQLTTLILQTAGTSKLNGYVPDLPFAQYTGGCCLGDGFDCPLPEGSDACKCPGKGSGATCH
jgi:hypothetical protein